MMFFFILYDILFPHHNMKTSPHTNYQHSETFVHEFKQDKLAKMLYPKTDSLINRANC